MPVKILLNCNFLGFQGSIGVEGENMLSFHSYLLSFLEPPTIPNVFGGSSFFLSGPGTVFIVCGAIQGQDAVAI
jgi:hypothetical protein